MNIQEILFPIVYTALFGFAILFLVTTPNNKFYLKTLFTVFVSSLGVWGWCEILLNSVVLRNYVVPITELGFFAAEIAVISLLCIGFELAGFSFKKYRVLLILLILQGLFIFLPNFMILGYVDLTTHINLTPGYGNMLYNTKIILLIIVALLLFTIQFKRGDTLTKKRISPILLASIFSIAVGVFFNIFLPEMYNMEQFTSLAPLSTVSLVIALAYSIYKWNLLGITVNNSVSYPQISDLWKTKSPDLYRSIRDSFFLSLRYLPQGARVKKLIFPGGIVNKNGNVFLSGEGLIKVFLLWYKVLGFFLKDRYFLIKNPEAFSYLMIFEMPIQNIPEEFNKFVLDEFSSLAMYQKSAEKIFQTHIENVEKMRVV